VHDFLKPQYVQVARHAPRQLQNYRFFKVSKILERKIKVPLFLLNMIGTFHSRFSLKNKSTIFSFVLDFLKPQKHAPRQLPTNKIIAIFKVSKILERKIKVPLFLLNMIGTFHSSFSLITKAQYFHMLIALCANIRSDH